MVKDSKAEELEAKKLYRLAVSRRARCIDLARLPSQQAENFGGLSRVAKEAQHRMRIAQPNGSAFRLKDKNK